MFDCIQTISFSLRKGQYTNTISYLTQTPSSVQGKLLLIPNKKLLIQYTKFSQTLLMEHPNTYKEEETKKKKTET